MSDRPDPPSPTQPDRASRSTRRRRRVAITAATLAVVLLVGAVGYGVYIYSLLNQVHRSNALAGITATGAANGKDTNLLVMGLDSRLDENGKPLPQAMYAALHSGDQAHGGLNSNVLMVVHIPADGSSASAISIPRDDYVDLPGCPDGECEGKIKEAYGLAVDQAQRAQAKQGVTGAAAYQQARDAGRRAEIRTVDQFLGITVDHFVEVTMAAFYEVATVVQPLTVCVKEDTQDSYSGAQFHAGVQQVGAKQAVAFVRQRRDTKQPDLAFTDLDRSRRQQAFLAALLQKTKSTSTLLNPTTLTGILNATKDKMVIDSGLSPLALVRLASNMSGSKIHFYTLPVQRFGTDPIGQSVNIVDVPAVRATVRRVFAGPATPSVSPSPTSSTAASSTTSATVSGPSAVAATGGGRTGPPPTALTDLPAVGVPCVK